MQKIRQVRTDLRASLSSEFRLIPLLVLSIQLLLMVFKRFVANSNNSMIDIKFLSLLRNWALFFQHVQVILCFVYDAHSGICLRASSHELMQINRLNRQAFHVHVKQLLK